jgi:hypothetical protein
LALRVHQQRKADARLFAKDARVVPVTQADSGELCVFLAEGRFVFAQLRDVLTAEHSTVVAEKYNHGGTFLPQRTEPKFAAVRIRQHDSREARAEGCFHARAFSSRGAATSSKRRSKEGGTDRKHHRLEAGVTI